MVISWGLQKKMNRKTSVRMVNWASILKSQTKKSRFYLAGEKESPKNFKQEDYDIEWSGV